jgi:hypothetical protein
MTGFNAKYRNKILTVLNNTDGDNVERFTLASPSKISLQDDRAFSLPAGPDFTCPGATKACDGCYAQKGRHVFNNVQAAFARNFAFLRKFEEANDVKGCAIALLEAISPKATIFRIHESGDFHSAFAIKVWTEVAKARPQTSFWAYTRSFKLDFRKLIALPNVTLWASTDSYNKEKAIAFVAKHPGVKHAYGPLATVEELPKDSFICPVTSKKLAVEGACQHCMLCVDKNRTHKHVAFLKH